MKRLTLCGSGRGRVDDMSWESGTDHPRSLLRRRVLDPLPLPLLPVLLDDVSLRSVGRADKRDGSLSPLDYDRLGRVRQRRRKDRLGLDTREGEDRRGVEVDG